MNMLSLKVCIISVHCPFLLNVENNLHLPPEQQSAEGMNSYLKQPLLSLQYIKPQ